MRYKQGTSNKVMNVANRTPHASETAIGRKGAVIGVLVDMSGISPTNVVTEVSRMGRNRSTAALRIASMMCTPSRRSRFA
jgi:hypothetical protein